MTPERRATWRDLLCSQELRNGMGGHMWLRNGNRMFLTSHRSTCSTSKPMKEQDGQIS
jgi:hypothetical protein